MSARVTGAGAGAAGVAGGRCQAGAEAGAAACPAAEPEPAAFTNARKMATCADRLKKFDRIIPFCLPWPVPPAAIKKYHGESREAKAAGAVHRTNPPLLYHLR